MTYAAGDCDLLALAACSRAQSLSLSLVPALQPSVSVRFGARSKDSLGAGLVLWELPTAALSARPQSHYSFFPALPGSGSRGTQEAAAAKGTGKGTPQPGRPSWEGFLPEGPGHLFLRWRAQQVTVASLLLLA